MRPCESCYPTTLSCEVVSSKRYFRSTGILLLAKYCVEPLIIQTIIVYLLRRKSYLFNLNTCSFVSALEDACSRLSTGCRKGRNFSAILFSKYAKHCCNRHIWNIISIYGNWPRSSQEQRQFSSKNLKLKEAVIHKCDVHF